jgi:AraC family transcriptional regulator of adaptative response/methylated-DNA-[protein]-cysteine methyltransferase
MNTVVKNTPCKAPSQRSQHSKIYMRTPGEAVTETVEYAIGQARLGQILVARTEHGICAILFGEEPLELVRDLSTRLPKASLQREDMAMFSVMQQVTKFMEGPFGVFDAPLDVGGTFFQQQVWLALRDVPAGKTLSYSEVASRIGRPGSVRAVAGACAANAIAVAIPCHRVVRNDGTISGYRWGIERKEELLRVEATA